MKCIHCGKESPLRDRKDGRCPACKHPFAFEPTSDAYRVTDGQFKSAIDRVSGEGKVRFTARNLWYEVYRRWIARHTVSRERYYVLTNAVVGGLLGVVMAQLIPGISVYVLAGAGAAAVVGAKVYETYHANRREPIATRSPPSSFDAFQRQHLARWVQVNGPIAGLLPPREKAAAAMPRKVPADVAAFSFDRAVVTDTWETAQMLVANRFHFEHNCAVLSRDGYPDGIAGTVKEMLRRNPRLTVFALHDASPDGCLLPLTLREPEWFPDPGVRVVDLGLRPVTVIRERMSALKGAPVPPPPRLTGILSAEEVAWLAGGHLCELALVRPAELMRAVYRGIVAAGPHEGSVGVPESAGASYGGGMIWIGDPGGGGDTAAVDGFG